MNNNPERKFQKTRLAPTPSGFLHLGNAFSFAVTAGIARQTNAKIFLRIDDMDRERTERQYVEDIFSTLEFMGIHPDEGPANYHKYETAYAQIHRQGLYNAALQELIETGCIYTCACTRKMLKDAGGTCNCSNLHIPYDTENANWRIKTDHSKIIPVKTLHGGIIEATLPDSVRDFAVRKKDGLPAYQLTSIIDDLYFGVDLVVRGDDLWASTLAQLYLGIMLGKDKFLDTTFYHHQLLADNDGEKLSKSAGSTSIQYLRNQGKTSADICGMVAQMAGIKTPVSGWQQLTEAMRIF